MTLADQVATMTRLLATLAFRKGGKLVLPLREVLQCGGRYVLDIAETADGQTLTVTVRAPGLRLYRGGKSRAVTCTPRDEGGNRPA